MSANHGEQSITHPHIQSCSPPNGDYGQTDRQPPSTAPLPLGFIQLCLLESLKKIVLLTHTYGFVKSRLWKPKS